MLAVLADASPDAHAQLERKVSAQGDGVLIDLFSMGKISEPRMNEWTGVAEAGRTGHGPILIITGRHKNN
jgi:hypothetical protein